MRQDDHHQAWRSPKGHLFHFYWYTERGRVIYRVDAHDGITLLEIWDSPRAWVEFVTSVMADICELEAASAESA